MDDENYKRLIENVIPLNHDRYKSYFVQFFAVHFAILAGIASDFTQKTQGAETTLVLMGIVMAGIWLLVQRKLSLDIKNVWEMVTIIESCEKFRDRIKFSDTPSTEGAPASKLMLTIPGGFILIYVLLGFRHYA
ncbi:hypothetical protein [Candidatus Thiodiazotropha sp. LNASS1]|uniref:hypothetical protein n=1 Tax=Candidatus Thiodiazotropha sp. LNASS1 TaxID=3096260 RepID=UPI0034DEAAFA